MKWALRPFCLVLFAFVVIVVGGCTNRSSVWVSNASSVEFLLRFNPHVTFGTFGFVIPPHVAGWAWRGELGSFEGSAVLMTPDCSPVATFPFPADGLSLDIDASGRPAFLAAPAATEQSPTSFLIYSSDCAPKGSP